MSVQVKGSGTIGGLDEGLVVSGIVTSSTQINVGSNIKLGSAGIVTASNFKTGVSNLHDVGLTLSGGQLDVGSNIKIGSAGVVTATSFVGSGANLTGITVPGGGTGLDLNDGVKIRLGTGNDMEFHHTSGDNIINYINGNLIIKKGSASNSNSIQFDGNGHMYIPDDDAIYFGGSADLHLSHRSSDESGVIKANNSTGFLRILSGVSNSGGILLKNKDDDVTYLRARNEQGVELYYANNKKFETTNTGATITGNLAFPAGNGIDFSSTGNGSGTSSSELFYDYEEGTWTPIAYGFTASTTYHANYTRIGRTVHITMWVQTATGSSGAPFYIGGLPYTVKTGNVYQYACGRIGSNSYTNSQSDIVFEFTTGNTTIFPKVQDGGMNWGMASGTHVMITGTYIT